MAHQQLVKTENAEFYVEVVERHANTEAGVPFDGVSDTIKEIGRALTRAWDDVKPEEATVEFGLKLTAKPGLLTGILVEGGGEATLDVKLTWTSKSTPSGSAPSSSA